MCLTKKSESLQFQSASRLCVWVFHGSVFFFHSQDQSLFNLAAAGCNSCRAQGLCIPKPNFRIGPGNFYMCILYHSHRLCSHLCARLQVKNWPAVFEQFDHWLCWFLGLDIECVAFQPLTVDYTHTHLLKIMEPSIVTPCTLPWYTGSRCVVAALTVM